MLEGKEHRTYSDEVVLLEANLMLRNVKHALYEKYGKEGVEVFEDAIVDGIEKDNVLYEWGLEYDFPDSRGSVYDSHGYESYFESVYTERDIFEEDHDAIYNNEDNGFYEHHKYFLEHGHGGQKRDEEGV